MALQLNDLVRDALEKTRRAFRFSAVFSCCINVLMLGLPLYSLQVLDRVLSSHSGETLLMLSLITFALFIALGLFTCIRAFVLSQVSQWLDTSLAPLLMRESISKSSYENSNFGSQVLRDLGTIKAFVGGHGITAMLDAPWSVIFVLVMFFISPTLGLITLGGCVLLLIMAVLTEGATKRPLEKAGKIGIKAMQAADLANRNAEAIEAMGMMRHVIGSWKQLNQESIDAQTFANNRATVIHSVSRTVRMSLQIAITGTGAWLAINNEITVGGIIAASTLSGRALGPFETAIGVWKQLVNARDSFKRVNDFLQVRPAERSETQLPRPQGHLQAENLYFRPLRSDKFILRGINFHLLPGESLGIIGPSAAGKSTLARLLVGIWPATSGGVRLDGAEVYKWDRDDFGKYVGYLPQDVELFPGSIKENIARMDPEASDADVIHAAQIAGVHEMVLRLPKGYDTLVGERGSTLSPGQKQRIGLARAFYGMPSLLVLDEPNSNLDGDGEQALIRALQYAKQQNMTTVIVAHKPSLVGNVEKLLMIRDGVQESFGPRQELLARYTRPAAPPPANPQQGA